MYSKLLISLMLCSLTLCGTIIKSLDPVSGGGAWLLDGDTVTHATYSWNVLFPISGAQWIWGPNWNSCPVGQVREFRENFLLHCEKPITIYATADNTFKLYINSNLVLTGDKWTTVYSVSVPASQLKTCGKNELLVRVENWNHGSPAGLIYGIQQDDSCTKDCPYGYFNYDTCQCECKYECDCIKPQVWFDYPKCECDCKFYMECIPGYYFNPTTCSCECIPRACPPWQHWDKEQCDCVCNLHHDACISPYVWNSQTCQCECVQNVECEPTYHQWSHEQCKCVCKDQSQIVCPPNSHFNPDKCRCECLEIRQCPTNYYWDFEQCDCLCHDWKQCPKGQHWDPKYCSCVCDLQPCGQYESWDVQRCSCVAPTQENPTRESP